jgi:hypothetical protein
MSTEPTLGHNEHGQTADPQHDSAAGEVGAPAAPKEVAPSAPSAQAAEAAKLFEKLFANSAPANPSPVSTTTAKKSIDIPPPVAKKVEEGETFTRKVSEEAEGQSFQRLAAIQSDNPVELPARMASATPETAVPPPVRKTVETSPGKTQLKTQDIPTAVDAVVSDQVKAKLLDKVKAAKHAAKPELNFPERINNLKTQHDTLRARLASLE